MPSYHVHFLLCVRSAAFIDAIFSCSGGCHGATEEPGVPPHPVYPPPGLFGSYDSSQTRSKVSSPH